MILSHTRKRLMAILLALTLIMTLYAPTALAYDTSKPEELTDADLTAASATAIPGAYCIPRIRPRAAIPPPPPK